MRITLGALAGLALMTVTTAPALAQSAKIYAYPSAENYCPTGLRPVTIGGVICCGVPNQSMTYQQVMAHPVPKRHAAPRAQAECPIGTKGCTYD